MKNALMSFALINSTRCEQCFRWLSKINHDRAGYHAAKGYSKRGNFKRNQRKGL